MSARPRVPQALYPFEGRFIEVGGHHYHYLDEGRGEPVVMVHGNPTWSFYYRRLVQALRGKYRVLAPDHIGCGLSDKPDDTRYRYTLDQRVADLGAFLEQLELGKGLTFVAHDWGGMIAMAWAVRNPDRVARLVLMNTAAFHLPDDMKMPPTLSFVRNTKLASFCVRRLNLFARGASWMAPAKRMPKALRDAYCAPYDTPEHRIATLRFVQDIPLEPDDPAYATVSEVQAGLERFHETPILLLWGEKDFVFKPQVLTIFEKTWPHAEAHRFPDAGHYVLEDAAEEIPPRVADFLARHPV